MDWLQHHLLSILMLLPLTGAMFVLVAGPIRRVRQIALTTSLLTFTCSLLLPITFDRHVAGGAFQMVQAISVTAPISLHYKVGLDGLSFPLVIFTTLVATLALVASWNVAKEPRRYLALLLVLETTLLGTFVSLDFVCLWTFSTLTVLLIYFLTGFWGGARRDYAAVKFALFALIGSTALLVVLIEMYRLAHSFDLVALPALIKSHLIAGHMTAHRSRALFLLAMFAFLTRLAVVPLHAWLPDLHAEAPVPIAMLVAALLPAAGGYGIFRIAYPLFPDAGRSLWLLIGGVGVATIIFAALCAMAQTELKPLIAYSGLAQNGLIVLGVAMMTPASMNGAIFMMVAGGITSGMLVIIAGIIHDRVHHGVLSRLGGLAGAMPWCWGFSAVALFANVGLPGLCVFVGQILVLLGTFQAAHSDSILIRAGAPARYLSAIGLIACSAIVLNAVYTLRTMRQVFFGPSRPEQTGLGDLSARDITVLTAFTVVAVSLGILPSVVFFTFTDQTMIALLKLFCM